MKWQNRLNDRAKLAVVDDLANFSKTPAIGLDADHRGAHAVFLSEVLRRLFGQRHQDSTFLKDSERKPLRIRAYGVEHNNAAGSYPATVAYDRGAIAFAINDFNGDGNPDIASVHPSGSIRTLLGNGLGDFPVVEESGVDDLIPQSVAAGEFDGDGIPDLVVTSQYLTGVNDAAVFHGNGDGTFSLMSTFGGGSSPRGVQVADLNHDGLQDFVTCDYNLGRATVFLGNGDGTFQAGLGNISPNNPKTVVISDLNNDGDLDLALDNNHFPEGRVSVLLGNGDGTFKPYQTFTAGPSPTAVTAGDFDGDGNQDLALSFVGAGIGVAVLLGNGDGTFAAPATYSTAPIPRDVTTADFDQDGVLDLAVAGVGDKAMALLLGEGDGAFGSPLSFPSGPNGAVIQTADFNMDGFPDIAAAGELHVNNQDAEHVAVLLNAADWGPAPIPGGARMDVLSTVEIAQRSATITPVSSAVKADQTVHPETEQSANAMPQTKSIVRIIRAVATHSDQLADDMIVNWNI